MGHKKYIKYVRKIGHTKIKKTMYLQVKPDTGKGKGYHYDNHNRRKQERV